MRFYLLRTFIFLIPVSSLSQNKESFSVYFDVDRYELNKKARAQLDSFCLKNKNTISRFEFEIRGYCDSRGTGIYNDILSEKRVTTVKKYLLHRGMNMKLIISALGFGEREPVNENKTEDERQMNRRVDISIINSAGPPGDEKEEKISLLQKIAGTTTTAGSHIVLHNINFVGGSHQFLPGSDPMLNELLEAMQTYPKLVIRVEGHICCIADSSDGPDLETGINNLSEARAKAVMGFLLSNDIAPARVSFKGFGHSAPIYSYPEQSEEEKIQNRRVEIKIISK